MDVRFVDCRPREAYLDAHVPGAAHAEPEEDLTGTVGGGRHPLPTEEAFAASGGGYETRLTAYSNLEITAGRQFAETGIALARQMNPGPVPERPRLSAHGQPWAYGAVGPELK